MGRGLESWLKNLLKICILLHKGGKTISLNSALNREIIEYVERIIVRS